MNFLEAIKIALQSLWANKLRSVLTLLGVIIGVAAVITVVSLIAGIDGYMKGKVFNLGADVFIVSKISPVITSIDQLLEGQKRKDITLGRTVDGLRVVDASTQEVITQFPAEVVVRIAHALSRHKGTLLTESA